jgi:hypothetical protein
MAYQVQPALIAGGIAGIGRGFSPELWDGFDPAAIDRNPALGIYYQEEFIHNTPVAAANTAAASVSGLYNVATDATAGTTITKWPGQGGGVQLESTTDNEVAILQFGHATVHPFFLTTGIEDDTLPYMHQARIRFECRFFVNPVAIADEQAIFIGLAGDVALTDFDTDTGDMVNSKNFFGFHTLNAAPSTVRFIFQEATQTAPIVVQANVGTLLLNKWHAVGFDYNPVAPQNQRCSIWFDGVKSATFVTQAQTLGTGANLFPKSNDTAQIDLAPTWGRDSGDATTTALVVGSWQIYQELMVAQGNEASG